MKGPCDDLLHKYLNNPQEAFYTVQFLNGRDALLEEFDDSSVPSQVTGYWWHRQYGSKCWWHKRVDHAVQAASQLNRAHEEAGTGIRALVCCHGDRGELWKASPEDIVSVGIVTGEA